MIQTLTIDRLGHLGDGIAEGPVFVPRTLPGEVVTGEVQSGKMASPRIVTPSAHRIKAPCAHYGGCGGCGLLHADDGFVVAWKTEVVRAALAAQGLVADMRPILTSPPRSRRRASLSARRTKKGVIVGFHGTRSDVLTPVPECQVMTDALRAVVPVLERIQILAGSRKGEMTFTVTETDVGVDLSVVGGKPLDRALEAALADLMLDGPVARLSWEGEVLVQRNPPFLAFGPGRVVPPPGAFLQATVAGEAALVAAVTEVVGPARRVVDLFAGCGTFALPLTQTSIVHAVESEAPMLEALNAGWRGVGGLHALSVEPRDLFRRPLLPDELARFDVVVIDPPRAGAVAQTAELAKAGVARIASVSCNPVTFARDTAVLVAAGYRIDWVQVVDQFRWSPHVEMVAQLSRVGR